MPKKNFIFEEAGKRGGKKIVCGKNAEFEYVFLLPETFRKDMALEKEIMVEDGAHARAYFFYFGGMNIHSKIVINLKSSSRINYNVVFFMDKKQVLRLDEYYNFIDPKGFGRFCAKGFVAGESRGEYNGAITIEKNSQETDGTLEVHSFVLGRGARCGMLPKLDIRANNVKAGHAATVSKIDDDNLFYLQSRGMEKSDAMKLIVEGAFLAVTNQLSDKNIGDRILKTAINKFEEVKIYE